MWIADNWKDYEVLDTSSGEKLERWGDYILVRPDPQVIWNTPKKLSGWRKPNGHYHRSSKGGGEWEFFKLPEEWTIQYEGKNELGLIFHLKPFSFKHTGLFPEQAANWDWFSSIIKDALKEQPKRTIKVLNLFAYTGGATLSAAAAGASVTHVDAAKGMVGYCVERQGRGFVRHVNDSSERQKSQLEQSLETVAYAEHKSVAVIYKVVYSVLYLRIAEKCRYKFA